MGSMGSRYGGVLALAAALAVGAPGCRERDGGLDAGFQQDADVVRLRHLVHYAGLIDEYHRKRGRYPLDGRSPLPIYVYVANDHQAKAPLDPPRGAHERVSFAEFVAVLEAGLGREIQERFDPQHAPTYKPIVYVYTLERGDFSFAVHLYGERPFAREISARDFEVRISNAPGSLEGAWAPERLFRSPAFQAAVRTPMEKPDFFLAREREYADWSKRARSRPDPTR
jgi:hypothetical protein